MKSKTAWLCLRELKSPLPSLCLARVSPFSFCTRSSHYCAPCRTGASNFGANHSLTYATVSEFNLIYLAQVQRTKEAKSVSTLSKYIIFVGKRIGHRILIISISGNLYERQNRPTKQTSASRKANKCPKRDITKDGSNKDVIPTLQ